MAEILTYDPSNDPQAIQQAEERDAETLAIGEQMEADQEQMLAGKYRNAQELEKAYLELQKKLGDGEETEGEDVEYPDVDEEPSEDPVADFITAAEQEFAETGELTPETYEQFKEMSSEELVDAYMRLQDQQPAAPQSVELSDGEVSSIYNSVGGEESYEQLTSWAATNLSPEEVAAYDGLVESGNLAAINLALQAINARYTDAMGYEGDMLQGRAAAPREAFRSQAEVVRAMQDPRYDRDPAYRMEVMEKLEYSDLDF